MLKQFYQKLDDYIKAGTFREDGLDILEFVHKELGEVPEEVVQHISEKTKIWDVTLRNTMKFYPQFRTFEEHRHLEIRYCHGMMCRQFNIEIINALEDYIKAEGLENLKKKNPVIDKLKIESQQCFSRCTKGPVMMIGDHIYEEMTLEKLKEILGI